MVWVTKVSDQVTPDAVVVVPGIMGSELVDAATGSVLWGLRRLRWYVRAWCSGDGLGLLRLTGDELDGHVGRVKARGLLKFPAFAPWLSGFEPYTALVTGLHKVVHDPRAVLEFGYDWRLAVPYNARLLAEAAVRHLEAWRRWSGRTDAKLVLVAHSMGGLLCQELTKISGAADDVRAVVTLGTPFDGAAKAAIILNSGRGAPLPRGRLRELAAGLPGVHDLLPRYRCVDEGNTVRRLTPADVARFGGSAELARAAFERVPVQLPGHRALIGVEQPTISSLKLVDGVVREQFHTFQVNPDGALRRAPDSSLSRVTGSGDGTVPRNSALPAFVSATPVAQQHGTLARTSEAISFVRDILLNAETDLGPRLGAGDIGLSVPDVVEPEEEWIARIDGADPHEVRCVVTDADTGAVVDRPPAHRRDGMVVAAVTLPSPGIYRIEVAGGGSPVGQLVMARE